MADQYQKDEFHDKMRAYLDELRVKLDEAEDRLSRYRGRNSAELSITTAGKMRKLIEQAYGQLELVTESRGAEWENFRLLLESTWDELVSAMEMLDRNEESSTRQPTSGKLAQ
ncbi:MAG: hypothetical protein IPK19_37600 [Chloroflexi bacterium]|nr:hypothetical protein [Chloroflexota bacterium]